MTYAHEAGHFIDQQWLGRHFGAERYGRDMYASKHADRIPELQRWHQAVKGSRAYQQLTELAQLGKARQTVKMVVNGSERDIIPDRTYLRYVMTDHELFARSYSQYIATKSQYPPMLAELERERDPSRSAYHATQWADDDFEPIAEAFDDLFEQLGGLGRD